MARPKGAKNRRTLEYTNIARVSGLSEQCAKIARDWLLDDNVEKQREALKTLAPYVWPRLQAVTVDESAEQRKHNEEMLIKYRKLNKDDLLKRLANICKS